MALILGIDPGSRKTGYGVISQLRGKASYVTSGVIRMETVLTLPERLHTIFRGVSEIITLFNPDEMAIEQVFMAKNAGSALKLGQARGAAIVAGVSRGLEVSEYEARKIKQAVVGTGAADKRQVQHMVMTLLNLPCAPKEDAADALAVALCHAGTCQNLMSLSRAGQFRRGRMV